MAVTLYVTPSTVTVAGIFMVDNAELSGPTYATVPSSISDMVTLYIPAPLVSNLPFEGISGTVDTPSGTPSVFCLSPSSVTFYSSFGLSLISESTSLPLFSLFLSSSVFPSSGSPSSVLSSSTISSLF